MFTHDDVFLRHFMEKIMNMLGARCRETEEPNGGNMRSCQSSIIPRFQECAVFSIFLFVNLNGHQVDTLNGKK